jgi:hypothetical protein
MIVYLNNEIVEIPERGAAFINAKGRAVRKTVTLTVETVEKIQALERQHNSSMSAIIRAGVELLSKGTTTTKPTTNN